MYIKWIINLFQDLRELMSILNCIIFGLQGKSFKSFSFDYCLVCLIILISQLLKWSFGWDCSIDVLVRYISSQSFIEIFGLYFRLVLLCLFNTSSSSVILATIDFFNFSYFYCFAFLLCTSCVRDVICSVFGQLRY